MENLKLIAKTMHGMEPILCWELEGLGAKNIKSLHRAVSFEGDKELMYRANYRLRTAIRILVEGHSFKAADEQEMYEKAKAISWEDHMDETGTLATEASVSSENFKHSKYASLKLKDAIVDRFRERTGIRPNVDVDAPELLLNLYIKGEDCQISLDSSGDSLHKRGYRASGHKAPLNEILAAGMVFLSGWTKEKKLWDPMCGSGTLALEAAMIASNTPTGFVREDYAFMRWKNFDEALWKKVKAEGDALIDKEGIQIKGSDLSGIHVRMARTSAEVLGLESVMEFERADFFEQKGDGEVLLFNPPYGERLGHTDIIGFYEDMSNHLKHSFPGTECWYISSNEEALKNFGLRPTKRLVLFNGALECLFQRFDLYDGSRKGMSVEKPTSYADRFWPAPEEKRGFKRKPSDREIERERGRKTGGPSGYREGGRDQRSYSRDGDKSRRSSKRSYSNDKPSRPEKQSKSDSRQGRSVRDDVHKSPSRSARPQTERPSAPLKGDSSGGKSFKDSLLKAAARKKRSKGDSDKEA